MPETKAEIRELAEELRAQFTPPEFVPGCLVKSIADIDEYTTGNGWIEAIVGPHGQQRVRYYGEPQGVTVDTTYVDVEYFPAYRLYRVFGSAGGGTAESFSIKTDRLYESDFGAIAAFTDATGNLKVGGTAVPSKQFHMADGEGSLPSLTGGGAIIQNNDDTADIANLWLIGGNAGDSYINFGDADYENRGKIRYSHAFDGMSIETNATIRMWFDSIGNVGMGTFSPDARFEIQTNSGPQIQMTFEDSVKFTQMTVDTNHDLTIKPSSTGQIILIPTTDSTDFFQVKDAVGSVILNVDSTNERVGVGNSGPNALLHVGIGSTSPVSASGAGLHVDNSLEPKATFRETTNSGEMGIGMLAVGVGDSLGKIGTTNSWPFAFTINNSEVGRFDASGNFGVNTTGPDAKVDILSTTGAQLRLTHTDGTVFSDFTLNTTHDLTIKPSSTGQIILIPTTDSVDFFQVKDAAGSVILNVDSTNERVGVGTSTPDTAFNVEGASGVSVRLTNSGDSSRGGGLTVTGAAASGGIDLGTTSSGYRITFSIDSSEKGRFDVNGNFLVGMTSAIGQANVDQPSTTGAKPVLYLKQSDISEQFFQFQTTIGTGNAIEAKGAKTLTTTHFIKCILPGGLIRYFPVGTIA